MYPCKHNWVTAQRTIYSVDLGEVVHACQEHGRLRDLRERPPFGGAAPLEARASDSEQGCTRARALLKEEPAASRTAPRLSMTCSAWPSTSSAAKSFVCACTGPVSQGLPNVFSLERQPREQCCGRQACRASSAVVAAAGSSKASLLRARLQEHAARVERCAGFPHPRYEAELA